MRRAPHFLGRLVAVAVLAVALIPGAAWADAGDEYTEVVPEAGGKKPSNDIRSDDQPSRDADGAPSGPAPSAAESSGSIPEAEGPQPERQVDPEKQAARSVAKATAPASEDLQRSILERKGLDDDAIEARIARSATVADDSYLGSGGGLGIGLPLMLGLSLVLAAALLWRRRT